MSNPVKISQIRDGKSTLSQPFSVKKFGTSVSHFPSQIWETLIVSDPVQSWSCLILIRVSEFVTKKKEKKDETYFYGFRWEIMRVLAIFKVLGCLSSQSLFSWSGHDSFNTRSVICYLLPARYIQHISIFTAREVIWIQQALDHPGSYGSSANNASWGI